MAAIFPPPHSARACSPATCAINSSPVAAWSLRGRSCGSDDAIALMWLASAISRYDVQMIFGIGCSALPWYPVTVELQESACSLARRTPCRGALAPLHFGQTCSSEPTLPPLWHTMVLWGARGRAATAQPSPPPPPPPPRLHVHAAGERLLHCSRRVLTSDPTSPLPLRHTVVLQGGCKGSVPEGPPPTNHRRHRSCILDLGVTRVCTRVSKATRSVLEAPQWLIWTVLTYMIHVEC